MEKFHKYVPAGRCFLYVGGVPSASEVLIWCYEARMKNVISFRCYPLYLYELTDQPTDRQFKPPTVGSND